MKGLTKNPVLLFRTRIKKCSEIGLLLVKPGREKGRILDPGSEVA